MSRQCLVGSDVIIGAKTRLQFCNASRAALLASVFLDFLFCSNELDVSVELPLNRLPFCPENEAETQRLRLVAAVDWLHLKALKMT